MTNLIDQLNRAKQDVRLPASRKAAIKLALMDQMAQTPARQSVSFFTFFYSRTFVLPIVALVVILSGAATASASQVALPGDLLYPVKTDVVEKVKGAFARSDEAKAEVALVQLERRMDEGVELASQNGLSEEAQVELDNQMVKHSEKLKANLEKLSTKNGEAASELISKYEAILSIHSQALKDFNNSGKLNKSLDEQSSVAAEVRAEVESKNSSDNTGVYAENKIHAAGNVNNEVQKYIDEKSTSSRVSAESKLAAQTKLKSAQDLIDQAKVKLSENPKQAFELANQSIRTAQEAKALIRLNYNLKVEVKSQSNNSSQKKNGNSGKAPQSFQQRLKERWGSGLKLQLGD